MPPELQSNVTDHELRSHDDASSLISEYEDAAETAASEGREQGSGGGQQGGQGGKKQGGGASKKDESPNRQKKNR